MDAFYRYPHTPHLIWLASGTPRDDKILSSEQAKLLLAGEISVEEKLDGANLGFSLSPTMQLRIQNRGQFLTEPYGGQFLRLKSWLERNEGTVLSALSSDLILFGEWCAARHTLDYLSLPDWFLLFDVYDKNLQKFWSCSRRDLLARNFGLKTVPYVFRGKTNLYELKSILESRKSHYRDGLMEGLVIRRDKADWSDTRAKIVRADFVQTIDEHWRKRQIEWNRIQYN